MVKTPAPRGLRALRCMAMRTDLDAQPHRTPILRRAGAGLILIAVAALAVHLVIGLVMTVFWLIVAVAAVAAVIWALRTI
jgi:hypothetical protein